MDSSRGTHISLPCLEGCILIANLTNNMQSVAESLRLEQVVYISSNIS
jgi:hypothetical protein